MKVYLDNAASTRILDIFKEDILESYLVYANPSSVHSEGKLARYKLEKGRNSVAKRLGVDASELIFTSGATESNNLVIKGLAQKYPKGHIITTKIEHPSVLNVCKYLEEQGFEVSYLNVDSKGQILVDDLKNSIKDNTFLVSIMGVNNETGVKQPLYEIGNILKDKNIHFHSDLTQYILKEKIDVKALNLDSFSMSFHKIHGPKGLGLSYISNKIKLEKLQHGGMQEKNKRSGTESLNSIILSCKIFKYMFDNLDENIEKVKKIEKKLLDGLEKLYPLVKINCLENRIPNILNIQVVGKDIEYLIPLLDMKGICVSGGSACQSGTLKSSRVLLEQGLSEEEARASIRVSLSIENTEEEIEYFLNVLKDIINN